MTRTAATALALVVALTAGAGGGARRAGGTPGSAGVTITRRRCDGTAC